MDWKEKAREKIWALEFRPYKNLNAVSVEVKNLRRRNGKVLADIHIHFYEEKREEIFRDCEYPEEIIWA